MDLPDLHSFQGKMYAERDSTPRERFVTSKHDPAEIDLRRENFPKEKYFYSFL